jgi:O-antigen/teichoic acid export membrane protein
MSGRTTPRAVLWTLAARQAERLLGIVSISIMVRLLTPGDFGLVRMATAVAALVEVFGAFGFDWVVVRLRDPEPDHYHTAWSLRLLLAGATFLTLIVISKPVAGFYGAPEVAPLLWALAGLTLVGALENIGLVDLRRTMAFDREFHIATASKVAGLVVSTSIAFVFRSYWALIFGMTASCISRIVASYAVSPFRPKFRLTKRGELLSVSTWWLVHNVVDALRAKFSEIYIGRFFGSAHVGRYSMANELAALATTEFAAPVNRVAYTRYAQHLGDRERLREAFLRTSGLIWAVGLPAAVGIGLCAQENVAILLGPQWSEAVPLVQVLSVAGALAIMASNTHYIYQAMGRVRFVANLTLLGTVLFIGVTIAIGPRYGVLGVAIAQVVAGAIVLAANYAVLMRTLHLSITTILHRNGRPCVSTLLMAGTVYAAHMSLLANGQASPFLRLVVLVTVGACTYVICTFGIWQMTGRTDVGLEREALDLIKNRWRQLR